MQLRADQTVPYGRVAELIGIVQKAGLTRIGFVTDRPREAPAPQREAHRLGVAHALRLPARAAPAPSARSVAMFAS